MFDVLSSCDNGFTCMLEFKINVKVKKNEGLFLSWSIFIHNFKK